MLAVAAHPHSGWSNVHLRSNSICEKFWWVWLLLQSKCCSHPLPVQCCWLSRNSFLWKQPFGAENFLKSFYFECDHPIVEASVMVASNYLQLWCGCLNIFWNRSTSSAWALRSSTSLHQRRPPEWRQLWQTTTGPSRKLSPLAISCNSSSQWPLTPPGRWLSAKNMAFGTGSRISYSPSQPGFFTLGQLLVTK